MFDNLFGGTPVSALTPTAMVVGVLVAFALALFIAFIYKKTHKGLSYSQSFVFTLVLLGPLVAVVMLIIGSSIAAAFTLFGAFTLIRFRTAVKDTKDVAFVFWVLVAGLAVGTGNILLAILSTLLIAGIVMILSRINFGSLRNYDAVLTFVSDPERGSAGAYRTVFDKYLKSANLLRAGSQREGKKMEMAFHIQLARGRDLDQFLQELRGVVGIDEVHMMTAKGDIEY